MTNVIDATVRMLFDKGSSGFRFVPAFTTAIADGKIATWFGNHNHAAYFFKDEQGRFEGSRLRCQCDDCLAFQIGFTLESGVNILAHATGTWSVTKTDAKHADARQRSETLLEENLAKQKSAEKAQQQQEARHRELIAMSEQQQREMMSEEFWRSAEVESDE